MNNNDDKKPVSITELITKGELKFWLAIIGLTVSLAVAFTTLKNDVAAISERNYALRSEYEDTVVLLQEVRDSQIRMEKDIEFIKQELANHTAYD